MDAITISPLTLDSSPDLSGAGLGHAIERWYGFQGTASVVWGRQPVSPRYGTALYTCDVTLPTLTAGGQQDRDDDVRAALGRHLERLGLAD